MMTEDEPALRAQGLEMGRLWVENLPTEADDRRHHAEVLEGRVPDDVRTSVMHPELRKQLDASADPDAFWEGFAEGVRAFDE